VSARRLRQLLRSGDLIVAPGVFDGISGSLVARAGFSAAYMTGAGVSASGFGLPDIGLLTLTEMVERARVLVAVLGGVPLIADADTGYGSPINVVRTVREYERAGVAAVQLEDQVFPKRCGHLTGKEVVDAELFATAIRAAVEAREDPDLVVIARTDALAGAGVEEAIRRAILYEQEGADVIFVEAPESVEDIERIAAGVSAPLLLNIVPGGRTPELPAERLAELGYAIVIHPGAGLSMLPGASAEKVPPTPEGFFDMFGFQTWEALGRRYGAGADEREPAP
jgi:2-methylisocitrate lyase-like PEP mutase family enzyme